MARRYYAGVTIGKGYESLVRIDDGIEAYYFDKTNTRWMHNSDSLKAKISPTDYDEITKEQAAELAKKWGGKL